MAYPDTLLSCVAEDGRVDNSKQPKRSSQSTVSGKGSRKAMLKTLDDSWQLKHTPIAHRPADIQEVRYARLNYMVSFMLWYKLQVQHST